MLRAEWKAVPLKPLATNPPEGAAASSVAPPEPTITTKLTVKSPPASAAPTQRQ